MSQPLSPRCRLGAGMSTGRSWGRIKARVFGAGVKATGVADADGDIAEVGRRVLLRGEAAVVTGGTVLTGRGRLDVRRLLQAW